METVTEIHIYLFWKPFQNMQFLLNVAAWLRKKKK